MPYPEACPECAGPFRNTGTHFTARRSEVGRHVLLELGCQNTERRFWWDFTLGLVTTDGRTPAAGAPPRPAPAEREKERSLEHELSAAGARAGGLANGHANGLANGLLKPAVETRKAAPAPAAAPAPVPVPTPAPVPAPAPVAIHVEPPAPPIVEVAPVVVAAPPAPAPAVPVAPAAAEAVPVRDEEQASLRQRFVRQLELDRLTLRQMRAWVVADEGRRAAEVAASATEATYERLALAMFGVGLAGLRADGAPSATREEPSAEEKLEQQREKARIRARQRRAQLKAARQTSAAD